MPEFKKNIPLSEPLFGGNEWKYVKDCLDTTYVSSVGRYVELFEEKMEHTLGIHNAVACINGTAALHVSLLVSDIKPNDEVIVPTLTFIAPVNAISYVGAIPVFMDCDVETLCMDVFKFEEFLDKHTETRSDGFCYNKRTNRRIKAVIPVHVFGHPAEILELMRICQKYRLSVIEDAAEALGSLIQGRFAGTVGLIGCFSFNGNKIVTCGGGGMIVSSNSTLSAAARHLTVQAKKGGTVEYYHDQVGYNYRLSNIHAAIGLAQLEMLPMVIETKRRNAEIYRQFFSDIPDAELFWEKEYIQSNFWLHAIKVPKERKQHLINSLLNQNIGVRPVWNLAHTLPMYANCEAYKIANAVEAYETVLNLPSSISLQPEDIKRVCMLIKGALV